MFEKLSFENDSTNSKTLVVTISTDPSGSTIIIIIQYSLTVKLYGFASISKRSYGLRLTIYSRSKGPYINDVTQKSRFFTPLPHPNNFFFCYHHFFCTNQLPPPKQEKQDLIIQYQFQAKIFRLRRLQYK